MATFHTLTIKSLERPTDESVKLTFDVPNDLKATFAYTQGQHVTLRTFINGEDVRRSYSICSCPLDGELSVAIKRVAGGQFSNFAGDQLKAGDELDVMPPTGRFNTPLDPANAKLYVAFAGGSGITPIISIIETTLRVEPKSRFILFFGNQKTSTIIFLEELEALKNDFLGRLSIHHILENERQDADLFNGRIDADKMKVFTRLYFTPSEVDEVFTCGPEPMMLMVRDTLKDLGVDERKIHLELFTSPLGKLGGEKQLPKHDVKRAEITIVQDGHRFTFPYDSDKSILDAAFDKGANLPYACKGGVCSTCAAKLEEGDVEMDINYALEPDEVARGLILTCQAFPKSDKVVISFDV
jgi:ring-1,2-phenylacetyl-CoA epoxidase subunit PaaE